jgi:hypothetical protein
MLWITEFFCHPAASRMMQNPFCIILWRHKDVPHRNSNTQGFEFRSEPRTCAAAKRCAKDPEWTFVINLV